MGLTKCVDCGAKMGDSAAMCVQCGARPKPKTSIVTKALAGLFALVIAFSVLRPTQDPSSTAATKPQPSYPHAEISPKARSLIREKSKDADSLKFRNEFTAQPGVHCGEVSGKNSFGAYAGFVRFIAQGDTLLMDDATSSRFSDAWREFCTSNRTT